MQLVYFWIEKYGVLENQEINFNSGFHFEMRKDNNEYILERKKEKEKKIPKNFFEEKLENISCIVGKNGCGKTTLIDAIIKQKHFKERIGFPRYIIIFEEDNELFIAKNFVEVKIEFEIKKLENKILNKFKYIYF
ncbi:MAG: NB-ARC domain-containing protein, partial [Cetobacterium sp.]